MLTSEKAGLLHAFLGSLPANVAARLAKAVEVDRLTERAGLPHDAILDGLRPVLRRVEASERTPTPLRLFCMPFEDLLISGVRHEKQKGRIARASVPQVWNWLGQTLLPDELRAYREGIKSLVLAYKLEEALECASKFWPIAGDALRQAIAKDRKGARLALNGDLFLGDAEDIALLLCAGPTMVEIRQILPKPVPVLTDELLWSLRRIYDRVSESVLDAAPYVAVVAMARLAKPWEALKLALLITHRTQDTLISSTDMGLAGDILFSRMEDCRTAIHAARHPIFDVPSLVQNLTCFTDISSAIVKEVEILRSGKWGQRLLADRAAVGAVMDGFMERAPKEIAAALPTQKSGFTGGTRIADFSRVADPDRVDRALRYAGLMDGCRRLAAAASFGAKLQDAMDEATQNLRSYSEDLVKELRTVAGPRRENAERQFELAIELTRLLFSPEDAEYLRRRGKAATSSAVAA
ncbi:MAG: hypothetical protein KGJ53_13220 [Alphaproteobacteria bacterium]|nr:hypothetical protein [Alphaproteobacteria bacterium]MDE2164119.1 hypothetical protein [Alphaproteobacteria bacterium]